MTGLDKIIDDIRKDSADTIDSIMKEAEAKAAVIMDNAKKEAEEERGKIRAETERSLSDSMKRTLSAADLYKRKAYLETKQSLIAEVIDKALTEASAMPDDAYFQTVEAMAVKAAHAGEAGTICFSGRDLERLPDNFESGLNARLKNGARLTVAREAAPIGSGFLLKYNGIEENCTFASVFAAKKEELQDLVRALLFS